MKKHIRRLKRGEPHVQAIILAAGQGAIAKAYEPKCLLKYKGRTILEWQIDAIKNRFKNVDITIVGGIEKEKLIRKLPDGCRFIENQIYESSNNAESLRIAIENSLLDNILFMHGDLIFQPSLLNKIYPHESSILVDSLGQFKRGEIGANISEDNFLTLLSYSMSTKWCQIAFLAEKDVKVLRRLFLKTEYKTQHLLTFEVINKLIEDSLVRFKVVDIGNEFIKEIDNIKDLS